MKIIILKNEKDLGLCGEIKNVPTGYARNYLIPAGIARAANKQNLSIATAKKKMIEHQVTMSKKNKLALARKIAEQKIILKLKADSNGTLYAGLSKKMIIEKLLKLGYRLEEKEIKIAKPIKKIGKKKIKVKLSGKEVAIYLEIVALK